MTAQRRPLGLTPEIDDFRRQFEQLSAEADALVAPLTDAQFTGGRRRRPGPWRSASST